MRVWQIVLTWLFVRLCLIGGKEFLTVAQHVRHLQLLQAPEFFSTFLVTTRVRLSSFSYRVLLTTAYG